MLFIFNDEPDLSSIPPYVVPLKNRQEFGQALRERTTWVIAPYFVIALPVEDFTSVIHRWAAQVDSFAAYEYSLRTRYVVTLCLGHDSPMSPAKLLPAANGPTPKAWANV